MSIWKKRVKQQGFGYLTPETMKQLKRLGMADKAIAGWMGKTELEIRTLRKQWGVLPTYKMVDTCASGV